MVIDPESDLVAEWRVTRERERSSGGVLIDPESDLEWRSDDRDSSYKLDGPVLEQTDGD